jgi:hypothetical protein
LRNKKIGDNPSEEFPNPEMLEIWVELLQTPLTDVQYSNIPQELKKKYIASGFDLNYNKLENSEPTVLTYYAKKQKEKLLDKRLESLTDNDIALLNTPIMKNIKAQLKSKLVTQISFDDDSVSIEYPSNKISKLIALYGLDEILDAIPNTITYFKFSNKTDNTLNISFENVLAKCKLLENLTLEKCISKLPNSVLDLHNLEHMNLRNNPLLVELPPIETMPNLQYVSLKNTGVLNNLSESFTKVFSEQNNGNFIKPD